MVYKSHTRTELLRVLIQGEDRPALVRADHDVRAADPRERVLYDLGHVRLPFALDGRHVQLRVADHRVDDRRLAQRPDDDRRLVVRMRRRRHILECRLHPRHSVDVRHKVACSALYARPLVRGDQDRRRLPRFDDNKEVRRILESDAVVCADGADAAREREEAEGQCGPPMGSHGAERERDRNNKESEGRKDRKRNASAIQEGPPGASLALLIKCGGLHSQAAHQHSMATCSEPCHHVLRDFDEAGRIGPNALANVSKSSGTWDSAPGPSGSSIICLAGACSFRPTWGAVLKLDGTFELLKTAMQV